jgi:hypothetical protein
MSTDRRLSHAWLALGAVVFLGAHVVALHHVASRFALPAAATIGVALLVVATHSGVFARLRDRVRRRP